MVTHIITSADVDQTKATHSFTSVISRSVPTVQEELKAAIGRYASRNLESKAAHLKALELMPGGNTRSVLYNDPFPICMERGQDHSLWDVDGHKYLDLVGEMTAGLYGHSNEVIQETMASTFNQTGVSLGAHHLEEQKLASIIHERFPLIEHMRFCNSGTEANLYALSIARKVTGKRKVIAFQGGYHGGVLGFAHGVSANNVDPADWLVGAYNDIAQLRTMFDSNEDVAAVIVEAMQGAGGCLPADIEFLRATEELASKHNAIFILDEVMTSRLHPSGLQGKYGLRPDLTTLGKYIGGGFAFGAFGGRRDLLSTYDPRQSPALPHSGTFNNSTLTMAVGFAGLSKIYTPQANLKLNALGDGLRERLQAVSKGTKMVVTGVGAVMTIHFLENGKIPVRSNDIDRVSNANLKRLFWFWCIERGFWIAERGLISLLLQTTEKDVSAFVNAVEGFISRHRMLLEP